MPTGIVLAQAVGKVGSTPNRKLPYSSRNVSHPVRGWWRADQGITIATGVSQWLDLSGWLNHLAQPTGAAQPAFTASVAALGGRPALTYSAAQSIFKDPLVGVIAQANTVFIVGNLTDVSTTRVLSDGSAADQQFIIGIAGAYQMSAGATLQNTVVPTGAHVIAYQANGATSLLMVDGAVVVGAGGSNALGALYLGNNHLGAVPWVGDIAECILFKGALSLQDMARVSGYLKQEYGL